MAVPNVSEGRNPAAVEAIAAAFTASGKTRLLDVHRDADHHRAVFTLAGSPGWLADALAEGTAEAVRRVDIGDGRDRSRGTLASGEYPRFGQHPHVGAVDVVPVVHLNDELRGAACAEALVAAGKIGALGVPVFMYGELGDQRTRAELRRGGVKALAERMRSGELTPDFGPAAPHPTAGAALVGARPPLVAFNLELMPPATVADARRIAGLIREGGAEGLPGVRAIGVALDGNPPAPQVSFNIERPTEVPLRTVVEAVHAHAVIACAELVGLAPAAALEGFPTDVPMPGFNPARHVIEKALGL
jgi:glutamate formiminotransferase/glutamate formiminotransferase/formiminotetrahydrofolate cyclodeaminase